MISMNIYSDDNNSRSGLSNKIRVDTSYSQDGRSTESFFVSYDPKDGFALLLFEKTLDSSPFVTLYSVYDDVGNRIKTFNKEQHPKRT